MKRFFSWLPLLILTAVLLCLTGCSIGTEGEKLSVEDSLDKNYEAMAEDLKAAVHFQDVADHIAFWAEENGIKVKSRNDKYLVLSKSASGETENKNLRSLTLHCPVNLNDMRGTIHMAATAMTTLYSTENHGDLTVIFTSQVKGEPTGALAVNKDYLDSDALVQLHYSKEPEIDAAIGATSEIRMTHDLKKRPPNYTKAYKIEIAGISYRSAYSHGGYPNPITILGDLMASCKSTSVLFELADFRGGDDSDLLPGSASATIVLQENDVESFTRRFETSYHRMEEAYENSSETFTYKMTETDLPKSVISEEDASNIISLMYTLTDGTYLRSEAGELIAASNIGTVSTKNNQFLMEINAKSLDPAVMEEMKTTFQTTGGLCDVAYTEVDNDPSWDAPTDLPIAAILSKTATTTGGTLENIDVSALLKKDKNLKPVLYGVRKKYAPQFISALQDYLAGIDAVDFETTDDA